MANIAAYLTVAVLAALVTGAANRPAREIAVPLSDGATIAWLYRNGDVRGRHDDGEVAHLTVALDTAAAAQFERRHRLGNSDKPNNHEPNAPRPAGLILRAIAFHRFQLQRPPIGT